MKKINKAIMILVVVLLSWSAQAHQPTLSSTLLVEQSENKWILQVRSALTAFEYEVEAHFGASAYATPEEFQALVLQILKENLLVQFNAETPIELQNGVVKLGHETSVTFEVVGVPKNFNSLRISNYSFNDIAYNQSILMVVKKGFSSNQFILEDRNAHTAELEAVNSQFKLVEPSRRNAYLPILITVGVLLVLVTVFCVSNIKKSKKNRSILSTAQI